MKDETASSAFKNTCQSNGLETLSTKRGTGNPFASRDEMSMQEVLQKIERDHELPLQARQNICSAIRRLERFGNLPLSAIPANLGFIRRMLAKVHPKMIDISDTTYANTKSYILRAFRHLKLNVTQASYLAPLSPAWQMLFDRLPTPYRRWGLSRLMHSARLTTSSRR
jgi:hypothetical protein